MLRKRVELWREYLRGIESLPQISRQRDVHLKGTRQHFGSTRHIYVPRPDEHAGSIAYSQRLAVAATALTLRAVLGALDIILALPYMNRDDPATANMLGLFVDRLPLRLSISGDNLATADALLNAVSSTTHEVIENQMPYKEIQDALPASKDHFTLDGHFIDVLVIYNWQADALERSVSLGRGTKVSGIEADRAARATGAMFPLLFNFSEKEDGSLVVEIEYNPDMVPAQVVHDLSVVLPKVVQGLARQVKPEVLISTS
ncbi:CoA-dependent acyltransferase [Xylariaceae sp. AK1471]|nr:CoA-dependent acyltransferase [Xylariaceae sp. AK1471]